MAKNNFSSFIDIYKSSLEIAGTKAYLLNRSYLYLIFTYLFQGIAFVLFYPFFNLILSSEAKSEEILFYFSLITLASLLSFIFKWLAQGFHYSKEFVQLSYELRIKLGNKIKNIPIQELSKYKTGDLSSVIVHNVDDAVLHIGIVSGMLLEILIIPSIIIISMLFIEPILAIVFIASSLLLIPLYNYSRKKSKFEKSSILEAHKELESETIEYIQGLPVLKSINQVGINSDKLQAAIQKVEDLQKKSIFKAIFPLIIMNTLIQFIFILVLIISIFLLNNSFSIASLIAFLIIFSRIAEPLANLLAVAGVIDIIHEGFENIRKILNIKEQKAKEPNQIPKRFDISFEDVSFKYENSSKNILNDINLSIKENTHCAIIGESGSGKTTIAKLIMAYDKLEKGQIKIGGIDLQYINQNDLMNCISVVFQDVYLFDDTILNNIKMGKADARYEEIIEASKKAYCHEFISNLENGYDTKIGEIGGALSGGERQRISIARAILKDAPIVILDEISSSLDSQSEKIIQKALKELTKFKTVITITHNLLNIIDANNILVLDNTRVIETGTHDELMHNKNKYFEIYNIQKKIKQQD